MSSVRQNTLNGVVWSSVEKFSSLGINFIVGVVLARLLAPSDFGSIALLGVFYALCNSFIDSGFGLALIRKLDVSETDFSTVFYFNIVVAIVCYILLFLFAPVIASFFNNPILCDVLRVQSLSLIFGACIAVLNAKLIIALNFKAIAIRTFLSSLISGIVGIIMAYFGFGIWALVTQTVVASLVNLVFLWAYCKWIPLLVFSKKSFVELGSFGSKLLAAGLINSLYDNIAPIAIGKFYTPTDLGYYNRGSEFARVPSSSLLSVLQNVTYPIFAKIQNDDEHLISVYRKYIKATSLFLIFFCLLLAALAKPIIVFLLTDKWIEATIYLQLFCFAVMFNHINTINLSLLQVKGRSDLFLKLEIIKKTISISLLAITIPIGVIWICVSKVLYGQIAIIVNTYYSGKLFGLGYFSQIKDFIGYFFVALFACLPSFCITFLDIPDICQIIVGGFLAVALYYILLRKDPQMIEIISLLKNKIPQIKNKIRHNHE